MMAIIGIIFAVWIIYGLVNLGIGLVQIVAGVIGTIACVIVGLFGTLLCVIAKILAKFGL